jgi:hypothetical protein
MPEIKYDKSHHAGATAEARIHSRLRSSNGSGDVQTETQPTRTVTTVHFAGQQATSPNNQMPQGKDILNQFGNDAKRRP